MINDAAVNDDRNKAYEDLKELTATIHKIRKGFTDVAVSLDGFDSVEFQDKNGKIVKLGHEWSPFVKQFNDTLRFSLEQAVDGVNMMKNVNDVFADEPSGELANLKFETEIFMERLKRKDADWLQIKDKFQKLDTDVLVFGAHIEVALTEGNLNGRSELLEKYKVELKQTEATAADIPLQIALVSNIWFIIHFDMHTLMNYLDDNINSNTPFTKFSLAKLRVAAELHKQLVSAFETYIKQTITEF